MIDFKDIKIGDYVFVNFIPTTFMASHGNFYTKRYMGFIWKKIEKSKHSILRERIFINIGNHSDIRWRENRPIVGVPYKNIIDIYKTNHHSIDRDKVLFDFKRYEIKNSMIGWKHPYAKQIAERQKRIRKASPEKRIELLVERLAEINCAGSLMKLGDELTNERQLISELLVDKKYIRLGDTGSGGFKFIGNKSDKHKKIYLNMFNNF